jgi:RHS repeat-associated protein
MRVWSEPVSGIGVFLFQDHLGSVRVTGTAAGVLDDDIDYLPFGSLYANYGSASANHYRFTDDESDDAQSTTEYAVYRNLDPWIGRFNRPDPYDGSYDPNDPQSLNRYSYVQNQPSMSIDPLGLGVRRS